MKGNETEPKNQQQFSVENNFENAEGSSSMAPPPFQLFANPTAPPPPQTGQGPVQMKGPDEKDEKKPTWRETGNYTGTSPVRKEDYPPNTGVIEDGGTFAGLMELANGAYASITEMAAGMKDEDGKVIDHKYWFTKAYQYVTEGELDFIKRKQFYYPSYVARSVIYFERIYRDNVNAKAEKVEGHWAKAFEETDDKSNDVWVDFLDAAQCLVASMLAHIRFDLPRAEAWVYNSYYKGQEGVTMETFKHDFMSMSGIFETATVKMNAEILEYFSWAAWLIQKAGSNPMTQEAVMENWFEGNMTEERADTWKRAEMLAQDGAIGADPYKIEGNQISGNVTDSDNRSKIDDLGGGMAPEMNEEAEQIDDDAAREALENKSNSQIQSISSADRIRMIRGMISGVTLNDDEDAIYKILTADLKNLVTIVNAVVAWDLLYAMDGQQYKNTRFLLKAGYYGKTNTGTLEMLVNKCMNGETAEWEETMIFDILYAVEGAVLTDLINRVDAWRLLYNTTGKEYKKMRSFLKANYFPGMSQSLALTHIKYILDSASAEEWEETMIMDVLKAYDRKTGQDIISKIGKHYDDGGSWWENYKNGLNKLEWTLDGEQESDLDSTFDDF